jgi:hypothetical protein
MAKVVHDADGEHDVDSKLGVSTSSGGGVAHLDYLQSGAAHRGDGGDEGSACGCGGD